MSNSCRKIIVTAASFLDPPVGEPAGSQNARNTLEAAAERHNLEIDYRCDRNPAYPLQPAELADAVAVIADLERYDEHLLQQAGAAAGGCLRLIARYGTGYSSIDIDAARACGVLVTNTPGANTVPTAEWALTTLLTVAGTSLLHHRRAAAGQPKSGTARLDLSGRTLGVVGTGSIGRQLIELVGGFNFRALGYDMYPDHRWAEEHQVEYVDLPTLCERSDFISLHASSPETIITSSELSRMKPATVLVNCARGHLVDNRAVYEAVKSGSLWGYGLDEVWEYPDLPLDDVNIVVSPHVGSDTDYGKDRMRTMSASSVAAFLDGETQRHVVNS